MFELRDYQNQISEQGLEILRQYKILYLCMEVRTGKTLTSLNTANLYKAKKVLFLTKKRAIPSIQKDYEMLNPEFELVVINNESIHKIQDNDFDLLISDEHHRNGAYPKPNKGTKEIRQRFSHLPMIFLSGTPHPESFSQVYHQFWLSDYSPFPEVNFYKWCKTYVNVKDRNLGYAIVKDYSNGIRDLILPVVKKYIISFTQSDAGFETNVNETVLFIQMDDRTYNASKILRKNKFINTSKGDIIADTAVKEMQKLHQIFSGTVLTEDGVPIIFDTTKAEFILDKFKNNRVGIFYKFRAEFDLLKRVFGDDLCDNLQEFKDGCKNIALQIVSGSEGISLSDADFLIYYNIDFSAKNYFQSRDRLTTMCRKENQVFWIFAEDGIEQKIYEAVKNKKNYTTSVFKKDYGISK